MKIANLLRRFSFLEWGGTESAVWNMTKCQRNAGENPEIICTTALCPLEKEIISGIRIRRFPYFYPNLFLTKHNKHELDKKGGNPFSFGITKYLKDNTFDIVHCHTMGRLAKSAIITAHQKDIPCILSFHGGCYDVPESEIAYMARPLAKTLGYGKIIEKTLKMPSDIVKACDGVICVGQNELEEIKKRFPGKPAVCIPNGVNSKRFDRVPLDDFRLSFNIPSDRKLILCVSRIDPQKNQRMLLRLLKGLLDRGENVHLAIVGFVTSASYKAEFDEDVKKLGLYDKVTVCEGLPPESDMLLAAYKTADIFALASVHEPFGIVALEAWSAGLPLIASAVGGLKTLVKSGKTGYLFDVNSDESAVGAYYSAMQIKDELIKNAKEEADNIYSWEAVTAQTLSFYKEVIDARKGK